MKKRWQCESLVPAWTEPPVPKGFWDSAANRRHYLKWLGKKLGYRKPKDWYRITTNDLKQNHGGGVLGAYWGSSAIAAVMECFPAHDWKEWLFDLAPQCFWQGHKNRQRYMKWLGEQLGYRRTSDWYQITNQDFRDHKGGAFLLHYRSTVSAAVMDYKPDYDWKEWLFSKTPMGFWRSKANRRRYMRWLASKLDFERPSDWYRVVDNDFRQNHGRELLRMFSNSPRAVVKDAYPKGNWYEWMFARVPVGFWEQAEHRLRYVEWLGKKLRIKKPEEWSNVRRRDICKNHGGALLARYGSYADLLAECVPRLTSSDRD